MEGLKAWGVCCTYPFKNFSSSRVLVSNTRIRCCSDTASIKSVTVTATTIASTSENAGRGRNRRRRSENASSASDRDSVRAIRIKKVEEMRSKGFQPYAYKWDRSHNACQLQDLYSNLENGEECKEALVSVSGRVIARRAFGKLIFLTLRDESGTIQLYCEKEHLLQDEFENLKAFVDIGDIIGVYGSMKKTEKGELSIYMKSFTILTKSLLPLPDKYHGLTDVDKRYRQRVKLFTDLDKLWTVRETILSSWIGNKYIRGNFFLNIVVALSKDSPIWKAILKRRYDASYVDMIANPEVADVFRIRAKIVSEIRKTVESLGFIEVETPVLQGAAGGAEARPFVTYHNSLGQDLFLRIATELHLKRMLVGGLEKVFEIGRIFRNEGISTRHNPEFTTIEMYEAYSDYESMLNMAEEIVTKCAKVIHGKLDINYQGTNISLKRPWKRETMHNLVKQATGLDFTEYENDVVAAKVAASRVLGFDLEGEDINQTCSSVGHVLNEVFETIVEPTLIQPTFVIDYPIEISPLAKPHRRNAGLTERFELFICGRELANAFSELTDPIDQRSRLEDQVRQHNHKQTSVHKTETKNDKGDDKSSVNHYDVTLDEDFVTSLEYGMPPASGMGLGIDRLVMLLTNSASIRDVIAFPVLKIQH